MNPLAQAVVSALAHTAERLQRDAAMSTIKQDTLPFAFTFVFAFDIGVNPPRVLATMPRPPAALRTAWTARA